MFQVTQYKTCQILVQTFPEPWVRGSPSVFHFRNRQRFKFCKSSSRLFLQFRESQSSSRLFGFRIEAVSVPADEGPSLSLAQTKKFQSKQDVISGFARFLRGIHMIVMSTPACAPCPCRRLPPSPTHQRSRTRAHACMTPHTHRASRSARSAADTSASIATGAAGQRLAPAP